MPELIAALRFLHFAAAIALAGELAFLLIVAHSPELFERGRRASGIWLAVLVASGAAWFFVQVSVMSGGNAFDAAALETLFGQIAVARLVIAAALAAALPFMRDGTAKLSACAGLAAALLGTLAATGHGAAEQGPDRIFHLESDAVHLLAAGAWLGALPALAFTLRRGADVELAARATRRFSTLGVACVSALAVTGAINAWYTVGDLPSLFGTDYGKLLWVKLALFAAMLALAAANRLRWMPSLDLARLRRNALAETALGAGVLAVVAALGVTVPALHAKILWPFPWTLEWSALARPREMVPGALFFSVAGIAIAAVGAWKRKRRTAAGGAALACVTAIVFTALLVVPARPTTYFESPVPYGVASVMRGAPLYAQHCPGCHGPYGNGDGQLADSLPKRPPNLPTRLENQREGDLLWAVARGAPGTAMPGFGGFLSENELWDLLNFLRAQANVDEGRRLSASTEPWRPVTAPDFTFQIGRGAQESLGAQRGRYIVLLVFYSLPESLPRLRELTAARFARMGARVVAVPVSGGVPLGAEDLDPGMLAEPDDSLVTAYSMFTRTTVGLPPSAPRHVEFLIDRQGYIRARTVRAWGGSGWAPIPELLKQTVLLNQETGRAVAPRRHAH